MDEIDHQLLNTLTRDGRISNAELARRTGLSAPSVAERIRRLEDVGVLTGFSARLAPEALGYPLAAYIRIRPMPGRHQKIAALVATLDPIVECHRVTGEDCFVATAHLRSMEELESVIDAIIPFATTNTSILQSTPVPRRTRLLTEAAAP